MASAQGGPAPLRAPDPVGETDHESTEGRTRTQGKMKLYSLYREKTMGLGEGHRRSNTGLGDICVSLGFCRSLLCLDLPGPLIGRNSIQDYRRMFAITIRLSCFCLVFILMLVFQEFKVSPPAESTRKPSVFSLLSRSRYHSPVNSNPVKVL